MATTKTARATVKDDINTLKDDLKVLGAEEKARLREKATAAEARAGFDLLSGEAPG